MAEEVPSEFKKTHWGKVRALGDKSEPAAWQEAWKHIMDCYTPAMVRFARSLLRRGGGGVVTPDEAEDIVQSFLAQCIEKNWLDRADPEVGRFRVFVRVLLARYTRDMIEKRRARKRTPAGGPTVPVDPLIELIGDRNAPELELRLQADWAECMARAALARVHARSPKNGQVLEAIIRMRGGDSDVLAELFGEPKERMAVIQYRARRMLAEELWNEINETVMDPDQREQERLVLVPFLRDYIDEARHPSFFGVAPDEPEDGASSQAPSA